MLRERKRIGHERQVFAAPHRWVAFWAGGIFASAIYEWKLYKIYQMAQWNTRQWKWKKKSHAEESANTEYEKRWCQTAWKSHFEKWKKNSSGECGRDTLCGGRMCAHIDAKTRPRDEMLVGKIGKISRTRRSHEPTDLPSRQRPD